MTDWKFSAIQLFLPPNDPFVPSDLGTYQTFPIVWVIVQVNQPPVLMFALELQNYATMPRNLTAGTTHN